MHTFRRRLTGDNAEVAKWDVGILTPSGTWHAVLTCSSEDDAIAMTSHLNGGPASGASHTVADDKEATAAEPAEDTEQHTRSRSSRHR